MSSWSKCLLGCVGEECWEVPAVSISGTAWGSGMSCVSSPCGLEPPGLTGLLDSLGLALELRGRIRRARVVVLSARSDSYHNRTSSM